MGLTGEELGPGSVKISTARETLRELDCEGETLSTDFLLKPQFSSICRLLWDSAAVVALNASTLGADRDEAGTLNVTFHLRKTKIRNEAVCV